MFRISINCIKTALYPDRTLYRFHKIFPFEGSLSIPHLQSAAKRGIPRHRLSSQECPVRVSATDTPGDCGFFGAFGDARTRSADRKGTVGVRRISRGLNLDW